jgi:AcrR family transcriptional regulator
MANRESSRKRARRSPEEARTLILDAAERVFAEKLPDVAGLVDVAREAGVSHALVTHYFGTYERLVETCLERRFERLRAELFPAVVALVAEQADTRAILKAHRQAIRDAASDPTTVRLAIWALLSGRANADDFFPHRMQGLKLLANSLEATSSAPREDLEHALIASFAMAIMWTFGKKAVTGGLGKKPSRELDEAFEERTADMLDAFLSRRAR